MFEKEAEESFMCKKVLYKWETDKRSYMDGFKDGYNKANEWHYVKDGDLPKETNEYYVYSKQWGVEVRKFFADVGYFECRKDIVIAWKEIVLPKESE